MLDIGHVSILSSTLLDLHKAHVLLDYNATTVFYTINATALITSYTHYIETIVTNYNTSVTALPTSSALSFDIALPQIPDYNGLPGPVTTSVELDGTKTTIDGSTMYALTSLWQRN